MRFLFVITMLASTVAACSSIAPSAQDVPTPIVVTSVVEVTREVETTVIITATPEATPVPTPTAPTAPPRWEYLTLLAKEYAMGPFDCDECSESKTMDHTTFFTQGASNELLNKLNALGSEGWELVDFTYTPGTVEAVFVFKRLIFAP